MLDLDRLKRVRLAHTPIGQLAMANLILRWDYKLPRKTEIVLEGLENIPTGRSVIFAMNHPDRYNYWPFQFELYDRGIGFTATWVKGKYYEHPGIAAFMDACNNIPLPSRGYVISTEFRKAVDRTPRNAEYRLLRDLVDRRRDPHAPLPEEATPAVRAFITSYGGSGGMQGFLDRFDALFQDMIREVLRLTRVALQDKGNHLLVFPQGTRSVRLLPGKTGMMQVAWHLGHAIVPVGCNGSERCYPGNSPFSQGGRIVYRIGRPLELDGPELSPFRVSPDVLPLTREATAQHGERYQAATDVVMDHINALLDPEYQFAPPGSEGAESGVKRFV